MASTRRRILVIGGGASGMMAAIAAARMGVAVQIVERMQRVGKKLLATGNGRCNLTNAHIEVGRFHGRNPGFALAALRLFDVPKTLSFFQDLGLWVREEDDGKIFPVTDQASSVLDVLRLELKYLGVEIVPETNINQISLQENGFECLSSGGRSFYGDRVVLAAGGKSSPNLGSNGGGFRLAQSLGHRIITPFPALVQMRLNAPFLKHLQGIRMADVSVEICENGALQGASRGEVLFTEYGISGPPILHLSRLVSARTEVNSGNAIQALSLNLDLFPALKADLLGDLLQQRISGHSQRTIDSSLVGMLHKRIAGVILRESGIEDGSAPASSLSPEKTHRLALCLKQWRICCAGVQSWMHSQVTAGGVDTREVNPETMESKIVPGLFFAGEVLDIDGDSGGYNLQWAWSSGFAAGSSSAR